MKKKRYLQFTFYQTMGNSLNTKALQNETDETLHYNFHTGPMWIDLNKTYLFGDRWSHGAGLEGS